MGTIGTALVKLILEAALAAFSHFLTDMLKAYQQNQLREAKGKAEAERDAAQAGQEATARMEGVDDLDVRELLRKGEA
jgi:hypothetical protein